MLKAEIVSFFLSKLNPESLSRVMDSNLFSRIPYKFISQSLIDLNFPHHIFLESTNACNLCCEMCPRSSCAVKVGFMDFGIFKKVVDEAALYGPRNFCLHMFGEPLLAPDIIAMVEYIKGKNNRNSILLTTNGVLLDAGISGSFVRLGVERVLVSVIAAKSSTYKEIAKFDYLDRVEQNVKELVRIKKAKNAQKPLVYVRMLRNDRTHDEEDLFRNKWQGQGVILATKDAHNYAGKIKDNIYKKKPLLRYPCYHLWLSPAVNWEGKVSICCCDILKEAVLGDAVKDPISRIWQGNLIRQYRLNHLNCEYDKMTLCRNCDSWTTYPDIFFFWQKHKPLGPCAREGS